MLHPEVINELFNMIFGPGKKCVMAGEYKRKQGFILFPVLLFFLICSSMAIMFIRTVTHELESTNEFLRYRQLETIAQSFIETALNQENQVMLTNAVYPLGVLLPGKDSVRIEVDVQREPELGLRFLKVEAVDSLENAITLRQCRIRFSDYLLKLFSKSLFVVLDSEVQDNQAEKNVSITSKKDGAVFPKFSLENIAVWASSDFPSITEMQQDGLGDWIYMSKNRISFPERLRVNGNGIFAFKDDISISDNSIFTGRIILLADGNVRIGSHVKMNNVLILCKKNLTVGTDSFINGAVMVQQNAIIGTGTTIKGDREALNDFDSIISY